MSEKDRAALDKLSGKIAELPAEARDEAMNYINGVVTGMSMAIQAQASVPSEN